jgi:hypothetical protein
MPKNLPNAEKAKPKNKAIKVPSKAVKANPTKDKTAFDKAAAKAEKQAKRNAKLDALIPAGQFIKTRKSGVHGKGMFAVAPIAEGQHLIEYIGERIDWQTALDRHPHDPKQPNHTFYFSLEDGRCIDGKGPDEP